MCKVDVCVRLPVVREVVSHLAVAAILLELHVGAMAVGAIVRGRYHTVELPRTDAVGSFRLQRVVGAISHVHVGLHTVFLHLARHDVYHASHGVGTIEHRCRTAQYFHLVGHQRLIHIGNGMTEDTHVLRMSVYQHHELSAAAADATEIDATRCTARHSITHHATTSDEEAGHLFRKGREDRGAIRLGELCTIDSRNRHR